MAVEANLSGSDDPSVRPLIKPYPFNPILPRDLKPDLSPETVVKKLRNRLRVGHPGCKAEVWAAEEDGYKTAATLFNGAIRSHATALVKPTNAADVSSVIKFCREHDLEISVKGGGTGVHGWSVAGHVILDMSLLKQMSIALPDDDSSLQKSFEQLNLDADETDDDGTTVASSSKRPSLSAMHTGSLESTATSIKRSRADANLEEFASQPEGKKRMDAIDEKVSRSSSGDSEMSRPSSGSDMSRPGSGQDSRSNSTPGTSQNGSDSLKPHILVDGDVSDRHLYGSPSTSSSNPSPSSSSAPSLPSRRMTYVNPSPTATTAFPFVPTAYGGGSSSISYHSNSAFSASYPGSSPQLMLNENPNPPPFTLVTFGAGVHSKELDRFTAASQYGAYHVPTSAFPVGAGQFLLGGFGFIGRKHGLAMDNLVEAEVVLADGRIVWVGEDGAHGGEWKDDEDPKELWWGIRGAGPALGVVTRFRAKGYYLPTVYAGNIIYVFDKETAPSLLRHVRDCVKGSPRTLYTNVIMTAGPPGAPAIVVIQLCFSGPKLEGDKYIQAISSWESGRCLFQDFSERTFERQQVAVEEVLRGGKGRKWYIKSDMLTSLTDEVIDNTCARFHVVPDGCTWLFEYTGGGAPSDVKDSVFPSSHREASFTVAALHQWGHTEPPVLDTKCVTTAEDWINEVIHPASPGGPLPCFLQSATYDAVSSVYGESWPRLQKLKAQIDPDNFFRHAMWPREGAPDDTRQCGEDHPAAPLVDDATAQIRVPAEEHAEHSPDKGKGKADHVESINTKDVDGDMSMADPSKAAVEMGPEQRATPMVAQAAPAAGA